MSWSLSRPVTAGTGRDSMQAKQVFLKLRVTKEAPD